MLKLLQHQWKSYWRSPERGENLLSFIAMGLLFLFLSFYSALAGYFLPDLAKELFPNRQPVDIFNSVLIYLIAGSFLFRIIFQGFPAQAVEYYRALPVKRFILIRTLLLKITANMINIAVIFFLVPFTIRAVLPNYSVVSAIAWFASILAIELSNGFFTFLIKKKIFDKPTLLLPLFIFLVVALVLEFLTKTSLAHYAFYLFNSFLAVPWFVILPICLFLYFYLLNFRWLDNHFYQDDLSITSKEKVKSYSRYSYLENFGEVGSYIALELKMIFRNKRPRALFYFSLIFLIYPMFVFKQYFEQVNPYPKPQVTHVAVNSSSPSLDSNKCAVTFNVYSDNVPENASVYISGNDKSLGNLAPDSVNLYKDSANKWTRTIVFEKGNVFYYNLSLGTVKTPALDSTGIPLEKSFLSVWKDTTVNIKITGWKTHPANTLGYLMVVFWTIFIISYSALMYGQYLFGWEGGYFDFILSQKVNIEKYIEAKYYIMAVSSVLAFFVLCIYIYMSIDLLWLNIAALFYSLGVNSVIMVFMGAFNRKRMDLKTGMMSQQGRDGLKQFLRTIPMMALVFAIYFAMMWTGLRDYMPVTYGVIGVIALLFHKKLMSLAISNFKRNRYKMAVGFREK